MASQPPQRLLRQQRAAEYTRFAYELLNKSEPSVDQVAYALRQVVDILADDSSPQSVEMIRQAGDLWRLLCEKVPMENATALLIEGEGRFSEYPIARIFKERTDLIQVCLGVHDQFAVIKNQPSSSLVDSTDYRELIYRLLDDIQTLYSASGWPALRQRVDGYRQAFVSLVIDHVPDLFESARCSAREYNFLRAIETMDIVWHIIPDDYQPYLPPQIDQGEMKRFYQALETRRSVERSWIYTLSRMSRTKLYFNDILPDLSTKLPEHADVPIKDLESLLEDIHRAVEIEGAIKFLHECDEVIESIYWFQIQGKIHFNFEIDQPLFIVSAETNLVYGLCEYAEDLRRKAIQALNESITILAKRVESAAQFSQPDQEPITLLTNYWQLIWCRVSGIELDLATQTVVNTALKNAQKAPHLLAERAAAVFIAIREVDDLIYLVGILNALKKLNQDLAVTPALDASEVPAIYIPPLPEGMNYPVGIPELDDSMIDSWIDIINGWVIIFHNHLSENAQVSASLAIRQAQQLQQDIRYLKDMVWPKLGLKVWEQDTNIAQIEVELSFLLQIDVDHPGAGRGEHGPQPMDIITYQDAQINHIPYRDESEASIFLLSVLTQNILQSAALSWESVIGNIDEQINSIMSDQGSAAKRLHEEILARTLSTRTGKYISEYIDRYVTQMASVALTQRMPKKALVLWQIIGNATQAWANLKNTKNSQLIPEVCQYWHRLNRRAQRMILKFRLITYKREIILGSLILLAIITFAMLIGTLGMLRDKPSLAGAGNSVIIASSDLVLTSEFQTLVALEADRLSTATALAFLQDVNVTDQIVVVDDLSATATAEANQCQADIGLYQYNLSEPILDPAPGFTFISGTDLFIPTVTWEVTNLGSCEWVSLDIKSAENINDIRYILIRNDVAYAPLPSDPIKVGDSLKVVMIFPLEQASQIVGDWFLVANGLKLDDKPHLAISQENWIIPVAPSPSPTEPE